MERGTTYSRAYYRFIMPHRIDAPKNDENDEYFGLQRCITSRATRSLVGVLLGIVLASLIFIISQKGFDQEIQPHRVSISDTFKSMSLSLTSPVFGHLKTIPKKYTCDGENINPPLEISGVPQEAKSLALIMDDPDAPHGTWVHWVMWNIDPKTIGIAEDSVPSGAVEGMTSFGEPGYGGPCPPDREHRYFFKLYALDSDISLPSSVTKEQIEAELDGHVLGLTELIGLYERGK